MTEPVTDSCRPVVVNFLDVVGLKCDITKGPQRLFSVIENRHTTGNIFRLWV